jgi:hypothetical protein
VAGQDADGAMARVRALNRGSAADVVRAMVKLELVALEKGRLRLTMKGREFLGTVPEGRL